MLSKRINTALAILFLILQAACNLPTRDCARPDVFCVGLVTAFGQVDDHGLNQLTWEGVQQAYTEGLVDVASFIETVDGRDRAKNIQAFVLEDYDLVITVGISITDETRLAAEKWPDHHFIGVDQPQEKSLINLVGLVFPEDQGGFLAGALAALTTKTGKVSALCELEAIPSMWRYCEGFRAGVRYIDPEMRARVIYNNESDSSDLFNNPAWGEEQALFVLESGVDILFAAGGGTAHGALEMAAGRGVFVIGADEDVYYQLDGAELVLSSAIKQADLGVHALILLAIQDELTSGEFQGEYALSPFYQLERQVPPTTREMLEMIRRGLKDGSIPTGVTPEP